MTDRDEVGVADSNPESHTMNYTCHVTIDFFSTSTIAPSVTTNSIQFFSIQLLTIERARGRLREEEEKGMARIERNSVVTPSTAYTTTWSFIGLPVVSPCLQFVWSHAGLVLQLNSIKNRWRIRENIPVIDVQVRIRWYGRDESMGFNQRLFFDAFIFDRISG